MLQSVTLLKRESEVTSWERRYRLRNSVAMAELDCVHGESCAEGVTSCGVLRWLLGILCIVLR